MRPLQGCDSLAEGSPAVGRNASKAPVWLPDLFSPRSFPGLGSPGVEAPGLLRWRRPAISGVMLPYLQGPVF